MGSPWPGASILITSAPMSPRICPQNGPAISVPSSRTRRSLRAPDGFTGESDMARALYRPVCGRSSGAGWRRGRPAEVRTIRGMVSERIDIVEVGPRDGLQSEAQVLPTAQKVEFVRRLLDAGLRRIEVASFVNPKRVPQMADAEDVLAALAPLASSARFIGLVLNRRGFDRAQA